MSTGRNDLDVDQIAARANALLAQLQLQIGKPLCFSIVDGKQEVIESARLIVFPWNSVEYYETGDWYRMQLVGPIAVPRNGEDPFVMGTAKPYDKYIEQYHRGEEGQGMRISL